MYDNTIKVAMKCGIIMTVEAYAISVAIKKVIKLSKENHELKKKNYEQDVALDLFEIANESLSRNLEKLEKEIKELKGEDEPV